jgi:hypothetical protein
MFIWLICILMMLEHIHASAWLAIFAVLGYVWYLMTKK